MPEIAIQGDNLVVQLTRKEKFASLRRDIIVPLSNVESAEIFEGFPRGLGIRCPGTGFPGLIYAGTFFKKSAKQFVYWRRNEIPVQIVLKNNPWSRIIVGTHNPEELIRRINSARV